MFKFDRDTIPYHISNMIFYLFSLAFLGFLFYFAFLPPLMDGNTGAIFANIGFGEVVGILFFLVVLSIPLLVLFGAVYHAYKLITYNKNSKIAAE